MGAVQQDCSAYVVINLACQKKGLFGRPFAVAIATTVLIDCGSEPHATPLLTDSPDRTSESSHGLGGNRSLIPLPDFNRPFSVLSHATSSKACRSHKADRHTGDRKCTSEYNLISFRSHLHFYHEGDTLEPMPDALQPS